MARTAVAALVAGPPALLVIAGGTAKHAPRGAGSTHVAAGRVSEATPRPAPSSGGFGWSICGD